jgi:hypothetical protein
MTVSLDELLQLFWTDQELAGAFRLSFEHPDTRISLLTAALSFLPTDTARLDFSEKFTDDRLIVLFTHNRNNAGARKNEAEVMFALAESRAITFIGVEGARGPFALEPYRSFPDPDTTREIAHYMLGQAMLQPPEVVGITTREPILLWGIEDEELYLAAQQKYRSGSGGYWEVIRRRAPVLFENLIAKMEEMHTGIAGVELTHYNFSYGHTWLNKEGISHVGIRAENTQDWEPGRLDAGLRNEPYDENEARLWELFSDWKRPKGWRPRSGGKVGRA